MPPQMLKTDVKTNEKEANLLSYGETLEQLMEYRKRDLDDANNKLHLVNVQLANLKDRIIKETSAHEGDLREKTIKFNNEMNLIRNDIIAKQNDINSQVVQQSRITADLQTQHQRFEGLQQDRVKLNEELMKVESRKLQAEDLYKQAELKLSDALSQMNQVKMALATVEEQTEKNKQENIRLSNWNAQIESRGKQVEEEIKNLSALKEFIEPKLRTNKEIEDSIEVGKKENDVKISQLQQLIQDEKIQLQDVLNKKSELEKKEKDFLSQKEEFLRQKALSNATSK